MKLTIGAVSVYRAGEPIVWARGGSSRRGGLGNPRSTKEDYVVTTCVSCGRDIPEGQGRSCSMCYGDPYWGRDGYYLAELEAQREEKEKNDE